MDEMKNSSWTIFQPGVVEPNIRRYSGRISDGQRFVRPKGDRKAETWLVEVVESVSDPPSGEIVSSPLVR
jgi:hypothetical protein